MMEMMGYYVVILVTILVLILQNNIIKRQHKVPLLKIVYSSYSGYILKSIKSNLAQINHQLIPISSFNFDHLTDGPPNQFILFILGTFQEGAPNPDALLFYNWIKENRYDHRVEKGNFLKKLDKLIVFGVGDSNYDLDYFCKASVDIFEWMRYLGAGTELNVLVTSDTSVADQGTYPKQLF